VVPISAPMMVATARESGMTPEETKATMMESNAPLLCRRAVVIQPEKTPLVVSLIRRTIFSARDSPIITAEDLMSTMDEIKKYIAKSEMAAFLYVPFKPV